MAADENMTALVAVDRGLYGRAELFFSERGTDIRTEVERFLRESLGDERGPKGLPDDPDMNLAARLRCCRDRREADALFDGEGISDRERRIYLLQLCMGFDTSLAFGERPSSIDDEYEFELAIFEEGSWRDFRDM